MSDKRDSSVALTHPSPGGSDGDEDLAGGVPTLAAVGDSAVAKTVSLRGLACDRRFLEPVSNGVRSADCAHLLRAPSQDPVNQKESWRMANRSESPPERNQRSPPEREEKGEPREAPRGLFTNLFPVRVPPGGLSPIKQAKTGEASKTDLVEEYPEPEFYRSRHLIFAFGAGVDSFSDGRFDPAIVMPDREPWFAMYLLSRGLRERFHQAGCRVRTRRNVLRVVSPSSAIAADRAERIVLRPEFTVRPFFGRDLAGRSWFAFAVDPSWTTDPQFRTTAKLREREDLLAGVRVRVRCEDCRRSCPMWNRQDRTVGIFDGFVDNASKTDSACTGRPEEVVRVFDRHRDRTYILPGHVVQPSPGQRSLLGLFTEKQQLVRRARVWLGDLGEGGAVRSGALGVRFARIQEFLDLVCEEAGADVDFLLPTGQAAELLREPLKAEEVSHA